MITFLAAFASASSGTEYRLDNLSITGSDASGGNATAELIFDDWGIVFEKNDKDADPPWSSLHPNETTTWHVRLASHDTGTNRYTGTPTLGTWTEISAAAVPTFDHLWSPGGGPQGPDVSTYTYELSSDGGSTVHDSMTLTVKILELMKSTSGTKTGAGQVLVITQSCAGTVR